MSDNVIKLNPNTAMPSKSADPWCTPIIADNGKRVSGGAARNVRIKRGGGMDQIISDACCYVLNDINQRHLRKV
jgi:hypothetical protein